MVIINVNGVEYKGEKGCNLGLFLAEKTFFKMPCGGHGSCGKCKVTATGALSPVSDAEKKKLSADEQLKGIRMACAVTVLGDCDVAFDSSDEIADIISEGEMPEFESEPVFKSFGVSVDIGTTTIAARLYGRSTEILSAASCLNSQRAWGADVISRIEASVNGFSNQLAEAVREDVDNLVCEMAENAGIDAKEIDSLVITGNTVMLSLLTGTCVEPLSHAPFEAERLFGEALTAEQIGLSSVLPDAEIYLPPCISGFVGADAVTAFLASGIKDKKGSHLMVDIGTNGEMALWSEGMMNVCSTAAGPAFEGVGISMGMPGKSGAIDSVFVSHGKLCAHVIGEVSPKGICGSGIVDAVAGLLSCGLLDETGYLEGETVEIADNVSISQEDIRMVQLAKSAIHAGIHTLLKSSGIDYDRIESLVIAGGFGKRLNIESAGKIGLLPGKLTDRVRVIGNGALSGASMLLLRRSFREECERLVSDAFVTGLSDNPCFAESYMECMMF